MKQEISIGEHVGLYNSIYSLPVPIKPCPPDGQCITSLITTLVPVGTQIGETEHVELFVPEIVPCKGGNCALLLKLTEANEEHPPIAAITV